MQDREPFTHASQYITFFSKYFQKASMIIRFIQQCKPNGGWSKSLQPICFLSRNELNYQVYHHTVNHQSHILEYLVAPPFVLQARRHCVSLESCWTLPNSESLPKITKDVCFHKDFEGNSSLTRNSLVSGFMSNSAQSALRSPLSLMWTFPVTPEIESSFGFLGLLACIL